MSFNGSGQYTAPSSDLPVGGQVISSTKANNLIVDYSSALSLCLTKDGQQTWTANQNAGGFGVISLGNGSAASPTVRWASGDGIFSTGAGNVSITAASTSIVSVASTGINIVGNQTFTGNSRKIIADMDNATVNNRLAFQTSTVNGTTSVEAIPNGSGASGQFAVWGGSDRTNQSVGTFSCAGGGTVNLGSLATGSGTILPLVVLVGSERARFLTTGGMTISAPTSGTTLALTSLAAANGLTIGDGTASFAIFMNTTNGVSINVSSNHQLDLRTNNTIRLAFAAGGGTTNTGAFTVSGGVFTSRGFVDNATSAHWNIDSSGRLLNNGAAQPGFAAYVSADQTSGGTIIYNTERYDHGSTHNTGTGAFTAPVTGIYFLSASANISNSSGATAPFVIRLTNGIQGISHGQAGDNIDTGKNGVLSCSCIAALNSGDTVFVATSWTISSTLRILGDTGSHFCITLLG